jgi:predicted RNA-binding Zn-ribbon protein involved in translation (DUF1610 family)
MPLSAQTTPACPMCHSTQIDRLPFTGSMVPAYCCLDCGHIWREPVGNVELSAPLPPKKSTR